MRKRMKQLLAMMMVVVLAGGALTACSKGGNDKETKDTKGVESKAGEESTKADDDKTASKDNGVLVLYAATPEDMLNPTVEGFEKETGIKVEIVSAGTGELYKRIEAEGDNPLGDIMLGGMVSSGYLPKINLWEEYVSENDKDLPAEFQNTSGKVTSFNLVPSALMLNDELTQGMTIEGYEDLLNPDLKGKIVMPDPSQTSSGWEQLINILYAVGGGDTEEGWDFVEKLMANVDGKILQSSSAVHKGVADGEYAVGLVAEGMIDIYTDEGVDVSKVFMKEGVVINVDGVAIIKGAKNMENAKKFIDYLTSKEYQQSLIDFTPARRPIRADIEGGTKNTPTSEIKQITVDMDYVSENKDKMLDKFKDIVTSIQ